MLIKEFYLIFDSRLSLYDLFWKSNYIRWENDFNICKYPIYQIFPFEFQKILDQNL